MIPQRFCNQVPCNTILFNDNTYQIRPTDDILPNADLKDSIGRTGILHPPLLQKSADNTYVILSGRKRILAGKTLGMEEIPCLIMEKQINSGQKWRIILTHSLIGSRLSIIEQAIFFSKAEDLLTLQERLDLLPLLELKPQKYILQELAQFLTLAPFTINALHAGTLQEKAGKKLVKLSYNDQQTVVDLIRYYKLGGSKQKKLITSAIDLVMRSKGSFSEIIDNWGQYPSKESNRPQQAMALLSWLETQRFPRRTSAQERFEKFQKKLQMPKNISVRPATSFEDDSLTLSMAFKNQDDLLRNWQAIQTILGDAQEN